MELLERFGLADRRDVPVRSFSRGMQQKVAIAVSMLHQPRLLLLDEPTLGLDVRAAEDVKRLVRELAAEGTSILLTTHHMAVAEEISHRVAVIRDGRMVAQGGMGEVLAGFSTPAYRLVFRGTPHPGQVAALARLDAEVSDGAVLYSGPAAGVYEVLQHLHPLELVSVNRDQKTLTDVFLQLTRQEAGV
jgi:ABC-2 type transport system ATP-binding protein